MASCARVLTIAVLAFGMLVAAAPTAAAEDTYPACWSGPEWTHPGGVGKCHGCDCGGDLESAERPVLM